MPWLLLPPRAQATSAARSHRREIPPTPGSGAAYNPADGAIVRSGHSTRNPTAGGILRSGFYRHGAAQKKLSKNRVRMSRKRSLPETPCKWLWRAGRLVTVSLMRPNISMKQMVRQVDLSRVLTLLKALVLQFGTIQMQLFEQRTVKRFLVERLDGLQRIKEGMRCDQPGLIQSAVRIEEVWCCLLLFWCRNVLIWCCLLLLRTSKSAGANW